MYSLTLWSQFAKLKRLTQSEADIREALTTSKVRGFPGSTAAKASWSIQSVVIVDSKIRANIKNERNTIIVREIASDTPESEIRSIFEGIRPVRSVRSDVGDTWYLLLDKLFLYESVHWYRFVTMENEEDAMDTLLAIRGKTFKDQPVKARLKSENVLRSFFSTTSPTIEGTTRVYADVVDARSAALLPTPTTTPFLPYAFGLPMMAPAPFAYPPMYPTERLPPQPLLRTSSNASQKSSTGEKSGRDNCTPKSSLMQFGRQGKSVVLAGYTGLYC
jgi:hypothetical protein